MFGGPVFCKTSWNGLNLPWIYNSEQDEEEESNKIIKILLTAVLFYIVHFSQLLYLQGKLLHHYIPSVFVCFFI